MIHFGKTYLVCTCILLQLCKMSNARVYLLKQFLNAVEIVVRDRVRLKIHHNFLETNIC